MTGRSTLLVTGAAMAALLLPLAACESPSSPDDAALRAMEGPAEARVEAVRTPFRAMAFTDLVSLAPDPACGDPPHFLNTQAGEGEATLLGRFTVVFTFCVDATDLLDDGALTAGESVPYWDGVGTLTAANGDVLYLSISGAVLPSDHPDFDFQFQDPFVFTGGTGRFADAGGEGMTDSFVVQSTNRTYHSWSGWLAVRPGAAGR
ncbi:MAG: hypothetical protein R3314_14380 [Longimicrobiales bacterium]|nr:hypothetical protein [Longimicrobiales bacterium]